MQRLHSQRTDTGAHRQAVWMGPSGGADVLVNVNSPQPIGSHFNCMNILRVIILVYYEPSKRHVIHRRIIRKLRNFYERSAGTKLKFKLHGENIRISVQRG
jgi:hypothetical protein